MSDYKHRPTIILCNSNAMFYQQMIHASHNFYLKLFQDKAINVFTWNYRGYGRSSGYPTPNYLKQDIEFIFDYLRHTLNLEGKIGIYGRSLGGIPTSCISNQVDFVMVDRSFSNFDDMARFKYFNRIAAWFFRIGSCGWQV